MNEALQLDSADGIAGTVLAIDIGGTKTGWGLIRVTPGVRPEVTESGSIPTNAGAGGAAVAQRVVDLIRGIAAGTPLLLGIGIASAGVVNPETGDIVSATNIMPGWGGTPLGTIVAEETGLPTYVLNDVHAHGLGEAIHGAGRGARNVLVAAVGTGLGGAFVSDGRVALGEHNIAGHFGHVHHHFANGQPCSCGRTGHIEAICSGSGITSWFNSLRDPQTPEVSGGRELQELAESGDELALRVFAESATALGVTLGSLANCVDPGVVVLSGSMTKSGQAWWDAVRAGYRDSAMNPVRDVEILDGELGSAAPLIGAAQHFLSEHARRQTTSS